MKSITIELRQRRFHYLYFLRLKTELTHLFEKTTTFRVISENDDNGDYRNFRRLKNLIYHSLSGNSIEATKQYIQRIQSIDPEYFKYIKQHAYRSRKARNLLFLIVLYETYSHFLGKISDIQPLHEVSRIISESEAKEAELKEIDSLWAEIEKAEIPKSLFVPLQNLFRGCQENGTRYRTLAEVKSKKEELKKAWKITQTKIELQQLRASEVKTPLPQPPMPVRKISPELNPVKNLRGAVVKLLQPGSRIDLSHLNRTGLENLQNFLVTYPPDTEEVKSICNKINVGKYFRANAPFIAALREQNADEAKRLLGIKTPRPEPQEVVKKSEFKFPPGIDIVIIGRACMKKWELLVKKIESSGANSCEFIFAENMTKVAQVGLNKLVIFLCNANSHKAEWAIPKGCQILKIHKSNPSKFLHAVEEAYRKMK